MSKIDTDNQKPENSRADTRRLQMRTFASALKIVGVFLSFSLIGSASGRYLDNNFTDAPQGLAISYLLSYGLAWVVTYFWVIKSLQFDIKKKKNNNTEKINPTVGVK